MANINENYQKLPGSYLFREIGRRVSVYSAAHPEAKLIRLGIGDVTQPLAPAVIEAMHKAVEEMGHKETFRGYCEETCGAYDFLRFAIRDSYLERGVEIRDDEIFVSDGAKSDCGNIGDIFSVNNVVAVCDPVYPVYVDTNLISGREILYLDANEDNGFLPLPEKDVHADIIYLCSPNNPTGAVYDREQLQAWVDYALENRAVLLFDAAYESFITGEGLPHSIFEIPGAERCAIEFCSFSKTAGFTGMRCGYTVIRKELQFEGVQVSKLWERRQGCKFNGVSYITQRAAEAVFSPQGRRQVMETIAYYQNNARVMAKALEEMGIWFTGGANSPYLWMKCPDGMDSWGYFDYLLNEAEIVGTPGAGFGKNGEGYFRLTAFGDAQKTAEAMERMKKLKK